MEIVQKKGSILHRFTFSEETFNFFYKDKSGYFDLDVHYMEFPQKSSLIIERNDLLWKVGILWCAVGSLQLGLAVHSGSSLSGKGFWLMLGVICLLWVYLSTAKSSVFRVDGERIFILQDRKHDEILNEINSRRKAQLLKYHGEIDWENNIRDEIRKFQWLMEQDVITQETAEEKIAQLELAEKKQNDDSENILN